MFLSNFMENGFLNAMRGISFAAPSHVFCRLFLSSPGETGTEGVEISYDGYTGMEIAFSPPAVEGSGIGVRNTEEVTYAQSPVDAGTVRFIGIFDSAAPGSGNMYLYGQLTEELPIMAGESPVLLINEILFFSIGDLSNAYKTHLFNITRGISLPGITPHYSLWNGNPQSGGNELAGENYERVEMVFSAPAAEAGGMSIIRNSTPLSFNRPTSNWGIATHEAITDAPAAGSPVWIRQRTTPKPVNRGIMPMIEAGAITIGMN